MERELFSNSMSPLAYVNWDHFLRNTEQVLEKSGNKKIRIATKSLRCREIISFLVDYHERIQGLMCYSPHEAVFLARKGFDDILIGYPIVDKEGIHLIAKEIIKGKKIIFMVDDIEQIKLLEKIAKEEGVTIQICLDIDMSTSFPFLHFGVRRSPLRNPEDLVDIISLTKNNASITIVGVMGYEAQIAGVTDSVKGAYLKNVLIRGLKKISYKTIQNRRQKIVSYLTNEGIKLQFVNGGGSGSLLSTRDDDSVTEITAGSAFYAPSLFLQYREYNYTSAIGFALPIVRKPAKNIYTVSSGGFIASGATGKDRQPTPVSPNGSKLISLEGAGEVQTPVFYDGNEKLNIGDVILFQPSKAGEVLERFKSISIVEKNEMTKTYLTYRGEEECFL